MLDIEEFEKKIDKKSRLLGIDPGKKRIGVAICEENKINTDKINPLTSILDHTLRTREDKVTDGGIRNIILENSPNKNEEFFIVPKVID